LLNLGLVFFEKVEGQLQELLNYKGIHFVLEGLLSVCLFPLRSPRLCIIYFLFKDRRVLQLGLDTLVRSFVNRGILLPEC